MRIRLGAFAPSPMYYRSGLYRRVAADPRIDFTAIFSSSAGVRSGDLGYGRPVTFDADALDGFSSIFLRKANQSEPDGAFTSLFDPDVVSAIRRHRFDVLWLHGYYSATHLMAALTQIVRRRILLVREEQTLLSPRPMWKQALKHLVLRPLFFRSWGLFIGTNNRQWFGHYGMPDERLFHVPFCVDNDAFRAEAQRLAPLRQELQAAFGISPNAGPVILSVSRLVPKKQPLVLLDAFRRVRADHGCTLLVVGSGPSEEAMRDFVTLMGIPDVIFVGFLNQSEIARAYAASDLFVLASGWETWGLVVNEAMNFRLPVVVSNKVGCAADLVSHGENGYIFPYDRPDELARYLSLLIADPARRELLGRRGSEIVASWDDASAAEGLFAAVSAAVGPKRWAEAEAHARLAETPAPRVGRGDVAAQGPRDA